jgi:hypothetical protein
MSAGACQCGLLSGPLGAGNEGVLMIFFVMVFQFCTQLLILMFDNLQIRPAEIIGKKNSGDKIGHLLLFSCYCLIPIRLTTTQEAHNLSANDAPTTTHSLVPCLSPLQLQGTEIIHPAEIQPGTEIIHPAETLQSYKGFVQFLA